MFIVDSYIQDRLKYNDIKMSRTNQRAVSS